MDNDPVSNYRNATLMESSLLPPSGPGFPTTSEPVLRTPFAGNVRALPPPVPPQPLVHLQYGSYGGNVGYSGFGGSVFGNGYGNYIGSNFSGYGGFGAGYGGHGSFGTYNRFGNASMNPTDPEAQFIQLAEASSRTAFQSIESLVSTISNIASMLDSTFFALTSSFRAILGVAANFGRLRSVFAQLWHTLAIFRGLDFIYKKILFWLHISDLDPSTVAFKRAFAEAMNESIPNGSNPRPKVHKQAPSAWPVLAFISFIFTAPYLIMKLLNNVSTAAREEARNPTKWVHPIETVALYDFHSRNPGELSFRAGESLLIAPKEIQNTLGLLNTGWGLATVDGHVSGILPINYVKSPQQIRQERRQAFAISTNKSEIKPNLFTDKKHSGDSMELNTQSTAASSLVPPQQADTSVNMPQNEYSLTECEADH